MKSESLADLAKRAGAVTGSSTLSVADADGARALAALLVKRAEITGVAVDFTLKPHRLNIDFAPGHSYRDFVSKTTEAGEWGTYDPWGYYP